MATPQNLSILQVSQAKTEVEPEVIARGHRSTGSYLDDANLPATLSRHSPTLKRNYDFDEFEEQDRQRAMDVDSAMQLSRARSASVAIKQRSPYINSHSANSSLQQERLQERLSRDEDRPAFVTSPIASEDEPQLDAPGTSSISDTPPLQPLNPNHEPHMIMDIVPDESVLGGLPTYQHTYRSSFNFSLLDDFVAKEKAKPDYPSVPQSSSNLAIRLRNVPRSGLLLRQPASEYEDISAPVDRTNKNSDDSESIRIRRRKIVQNETSQPRKLGGKVALFEGNSAAPPTLIRRPTGDFNTLPSFERSRDNIREAQEPNLYTHTDYDKPFRFSFYSNTLSATIHARTLSELPAEGQSFESLFLANDATKSDTEHDLGGESNNRFPETGAKDYRQADFESCTWWLDVTSPTDEEMKLLSKVFSIHPLTAEDIQMEETREKIELFRNYYLVCFRSFDQDPYSPTYLEPLNMYIVVFREGTLSFHFHATPHPQNVRRRIKHLKDYIQVTSDWISYALIDDITDAFGPLIQGIEYEVDSIDELVLILKEVEQTDMLRRIGTCRKKVMGLLRLMGSKADVVKGLAKRCNENWTVAPKSDIGLYLSDIQDHLITMTQNLNHYEKILSRSHSNYLAQISIEMTDANNQINDVLSKLTALGTVLIPMNLITGLWGMNVHVPGEDDQTTYTWFISIIGGLVAFAVVGGFLTYRLMIRRH